MKLFGVVSQGNLCFEDLPAYLKTLDKLEGEQITVEIKKRSKGRSVPQNKYYRFVLGLICNETGYTDDEMHEILRYKFLLQKDADDPYVKSTAMLSTVEFEEYMTEVRQWASVMLNCFVPLPNEEGIELYL